VPTLSHQSTSHPSNHVVLLATTHQSAPFIFPCMPRHDSGKDTFLCQAYDVCDHGHRSTNSLRVPASFVYVLCGAVAPHQLCVRHGDSHSGDPVHRRGQGDSGADEPPWVRCKTSTPPLPSICSHHTLLSCHLFRKRSQLNVPLVAAEAPTCCPHWQVSIRPYGAIFGDLASFSGPSVGKVRRPSPWFCI
jgi:hypothetical protein